MLLGGIFSGTVFHLSAVQGRRVRFSNLEHSCRLSYGQKGFLKNTGPID